MRTVLAALTLLVSVEVCSSLCCRNLRGETPWYFMFKPPHSEKLFYADKEKPYLIHHDVEISSDTNPIKLTMESVYIPGSDQSINGTLNYFMFNDQVPGGEKSFDNGHTKGTVLFDETRIVYLIHSTPHFPYNDTAGYGFPHTGIYYGQHFFCVTLPISELSKLLYQIRMMWPFVYNFKIKEDLYGKYENLQEIIKGKPLPADGNPHSKIETLFLTDSTILTAFNKNGTFGADIFDALISPYFDPPMSLYTETWQNGKSKLHSNCTDDYFVKNIVYMAFYADQLDYKETQDHSKWAISADEQYKYLCFGGVNRMSSQFRRGGGMYCFFNDIFWEFMISAVGMTEDCPAKPVYT